MVYGYIRVSTDQQSVKNQRFEIERFSKSNKLRIERWIEETVSGTKSLETRRLGELLKGIQKDDLIICSELSRLGRSLFMIMSILSHCLAIGAKIWTIKDGYRLEMISNQKYLLSPLGCPQRLSAILLHNVQRKLLLVLRQKGKSWAAGRERQPK